MVRQANKYCRDVTFEEGQHVYISSEHIALPKGYSCKLALKWLGPFRVERVISPVAFQIELPIQYWKIYPIFHASQLKLHLGPLPMIDPPVIHGDIEDNDEYKVEQILDVREAGKQCQC